MEDKKGSKFSRIMGILALGFMSFGFLMIVGNGLLYAVDKSYIYLTGEETIGTIIEYQPVEHEQKGGDIYYTYIPEVKFTTNTGKVIISASNLNEVDNLNFPTGETEQIRYDTSNPAKFIITNSQFMANSNMVSINVTLEILSFIIIGLLQIPSKIDNIKVIKRFFGISGIIIIILTGFLIYEYLNIEISMKMIVNTSFLIILDIFYIIYFKKLLKRYVDINKF